MNAKHQASVGGKSSLPSGLATTQLRPGQAAPGRRGAPRVLVARKTVFDTCTAVLFGLWPILNKHFIAKPARATSLPRFVF